jgi:hypothetical protein
MGRRGSRRQIPCRSRARSRSTASVTLQAPFASTRIGASGPRACRTAATWVTSPASPTLSLKVRKPSAAQRSTRARVAAGLAAGRVALQTTGLASRAPSRRQTGSPEARPARSCRAMSTAARAWADAPRFRQRAMADQILPVSSPPSSRAGQQRSRISTAMDSIPGPPRSESAAVSPSPSSPSPRIRIRIRLRSWSSPRAVTYGSRNGSE